MSAPYNRTQNYFLQLKLSVVFKLAAVIASFVAMPLTLNLLGAERFGIWATMLTLVNWVLFFDFGLGHGLKNKVAESIARGETSLLQSYVGMAYLAFGLISGVLALIILFLCFFLPWESIFNAETLGRNEIGFSVGLLALFILANFVLGLVKQVLHGAQKTSVVVFGQFLASALTLIFIAVAIALQKSSIMTMVLCYGLAMLISNGTLSVLTYLKHFEWAPRFATLQWSRFRDLWVFGLKLFVIQLAALVIFTTDRMVITQVLGPSEVVPYEVLFKLFSIFALVQGLALAPLWPAYTDAYHRGDYAWVKNAYKKQLIVFAVILFAIATLVMLGPLVVRLWIGEGFEVSSSLYVTFAVVSGLSIWSNLFASFVNAIERIGLQLCTALAAAAINLPLSIYLSKHLDWGLPGILWATVASLSIYSLLGPIQVCLLLRNKE